MEAETETVETVDQTQPTGDNGQDNPYVSPEVLAAQRGEQVQMGMHIVSETDEPEE